MSTDGGETFGDLLRRHRLRAALSQERLAEQAGVSARGVNDLERSVRRFPYPETIKRLADTLQLSPGERAQLIAAGTRPAPSSTGDAPPPPLPSPATSFVGREQELPDIRAALADTRLLTLTGSGGVGKTRLALAVAAQAREPDGVWFVDLSPLGDERLVLSTVASALGIRDRQGRALVEVLCDALTARRTLLVVDNCEHVLLSCATLLELLLARCPGVRILATSREPLRIAPEVRWLVQPLAVPDWKQLSPAPMPAALLRFGAAQLFVERARAVRPALDLNGDAMHDIARICQRLEGVPLAIELAAARVAMFSLAQIAVRLDEACRLLSSGARTAPLRQQTLRATIDWSRALLPVAEDLLLDRLATFAGGCTFEAAEAVAGGDGLPTADVLALLGGLVDKSLIVAEPGPAGQTRYRLLEVLRQYGQEQLQARGLLESARARHAAYFLTFARDAAPHVFGPERKSWLDRLEVELDNFRAARRWFVAVGDADGALQLASALYRLWMYRGYAEEGRASLTEALALPGGSPATRANALFCDGGLGVNVLQTDYAFAQAQLTRSLELYRASNDLGGMAWALMALGAAASMRVDLSAAMAFLQEARQVGKVAGDGAVLALSLVWSAELAFTRGDFDAARVFATDGLELATRIGFAIPICMALTTLGVLHWQSGRLEPAEARLAEALVRADELDEAYSIVRAGISLALLTADRGRLQPARALLTRCLRLAQQVGNLHHLAQTLEGCAAFAALTDSPLAAAQLAGAAAGLRARIGAPLGGTELELQTRRLVHAWRRLEPGAASAAHDAAARWPIETATIFALDFIDDSAPLAIALPADADREIGGAGPLRRD